MSITRKFADCNRGARESKRHSPGNFPPLKPLTKQPHKHAFGKKSILATGELVQLAPCSYYLWINVDTSTTYRATCAPLPSLQETGLLLLPFEQHACVNYTHAATCSHRTFFLQA